MRKAVRARAVALAVALLAFVGMPAPVWADEIRDRQRAILNTLGVQEAWQYTRGGGVTVAVVDSGADPSHPDLRGSVTVGPNLLSRTDGGRAPAGRHGTGMASLIAGHGHGPGGRDGIIGVAPEARILSLRVIAEPEDPGYLAYRTSRAARDAVARGIRYAADHGADVINLSLGNARPNPAEREAIAHAIAKGVVVVSAVGNDGDKRELLDADGFAPYSYPAAYPGVIAVAATDAKHRRAPFSTRNHSVLLAAPGDDVPMAGPDGTYFLAEGTSGASALVSGVAALIRSRHPDLKPSLVKQALLESVRFGPPGKYNASVGFGEVNAAAAVRAADRLAGTPRGGGALPSNERFTDGEPPGPVKVIDQPAWTEPVAVGVIVLTVAGAGLAVAVSVALYRRTRPAPADPRPAAAEEPPPEPPPPLIFDPDAPAEPEPVPVAVTFEPADVPLAVETAPPRPQATVSVPSYVPGTGPRPKAPAFEPPDLPPGPPPPEPAQRKRRVPLVLDPPPGAGRPTFEPPYPPAPVAPSLAPLQPVVGAYGPWPPPGAPAPPYGTPWPPPNGPSGRPWPSPGAPASPYGTPWPPPNAPGPMQPPPDGNRTA